MVEVAVMIPILAAVVDQTLESAAVVDLNGVVVVPWFVAVLLAFHFYHNLTMLTDFSLEEVEAAVIKITALEQQEEMVVE
jgi:hypothetical protein